MVILIQLTGFKITWIHLRYFRMDNFDPIEISMRLWLWSTPNIFERVNVIYPGFVNGGFDSVSNNKIFSNLLLWKWIKVTFCHVMKFLLVNSVVNQSGPRNQSCKKLSLGLLPQHIQVDQNIGLFVWIFLSNCNSYAVYAL